MVNLSDHFSKIVPLFAHDRFADAFRALLVFPFCILTKGDTFF